MIRFEDLVDKVRSYSPDADLELLRRAYVFSAREHKGQVRHSGEPYLVHPLEVANLLVDMRLDAVAVAAGLLHDVVEDTLTSIDRVAELFGPEVAHVVEGVTKLSSIPFSSKEAQQAENFRACSWRWSTTSASSWSSLPTACTTCAPSGTSPTRSASASPGRPSTSTRPSPTGWA